MRDLDEKIRAGWSGSRISMQQARESGAGVIDACGLVWRNAKLAVRCFFFAIFLWIAGGCAEKPVPPECQFYVDEIQNVEGCLTIGGCNHPKYQDEDYRAHMEAELGYCKRRATMAEGNALKREHE